MPNQSCPEELSRLLEKSLACSSCQTNVPLVGYTKLKMGGPAEVLVGLGCEEDLASCLTIAKSLNAPVTILGNGSNVLISDCGVQGLVIHIGEGFSAIQRDGSVLTAQAGAAVQKLCHAALEASLSGLEFAYGIPGSVGGAICMNAGAYGSEMKNVVSSVRIMDASGEIRRLSGNEMHFAYRHSLMMEEASPAVVLSASFELVPGNQDEIRAAMEDFMRRRREKQPLQYPSCGSTFKRPEGHFAGALIEGCGLKGFRVGGCCVSELHAGFLINDRGGTASDYWRLICKVRETVLAQTGVLLEPEVRILGKMEDA